MYYDCIHLPDKMIATAWQNSNGNSKRSKISQGRSSDVDDGTKDVRRNELRRIEPRLNESNDGRRISLFCIINERKADSKENTVR